METQYGMNIREIAEKLNNLSVNYRIGELQKIRKEIKGLKRLPGTKLFHDSTISDEGWAFHYGGRKELQFNIGFEKEGLRFGIAFSLETSQSLPDVSILYPKILKLNCIIRENADFFSEYRMWFWQNVRSDIMPVAVIPNDFIQPHTFIFFGKISDKIDFNDILYTFDKLLDIYMQVESDHHLVKTVKIQKIEDFKFDTRNTKLMLSRKYLSKEKEINITVRHSCLQIACYRQLSEKFGKNNVSIENPWNGNRIDIVVKTDNGFRFYEVKVASSAKACIREALGQLLEYAFWPGKRRADKIVIVGEHPIDEEGRHYIEFLRSEFKLPLEYEQIKLQGA